MFKDDHTVTKKMGKGFCSARTEPQETLLREKKKSQGEGTHNYVIIYSKKGRNVILKSPFRFYGQKETQAVLTVVT